MAASRDPMQGDGTPRWLQTQAGYAWRFLVIVAALLVLARAVMAVELVAMALFLSLVIAAVLRPLTRLLAKVLPRPLATLISFLAALAVLTGIITFVTVSVSNQIPRLTEALISGINDIDALIKSAPRPISDIDITHTGQAIQDWLAANGSMVASEVITRLGTLGETLTGLVLALFCSVFFINSGSQMFQWTISQFHEEAGRRIAAAGRAAWRAFSGYTRGIVLVGVTNGLFAGLGLALMGIPLAAPIGVLVAIGTFIPYVGSAIALSVAIVVALAVKGVWWALAVVGMIVVIGQIEGHLLQPLIMARQVKLHPVVVAGAVVAGTLVVGIIGAIAAVPLVSMIWAAFSTLRTLRAADDVPPAPVPGLPDRSQATPSV
ncbi:MAG: AI-2E family transporter [Bifidobacteriaceae bacterium]|jgi:predicted PurR-regulated permease PerM|nr:AI-2E family transporter [Bifidobacteriaceae bacterium]